jgi:hypothetical protein
MATYRAYFIGWSGAIRGRDDFDAESDADAIAIAEALCDACSDVCKAFDLWQRTRHVSTSFSSRFKLSSEQIAAKNQETVLQRELVIRDSKWLIASSKRLVEQIQRMLN